MTVSRPPVGLNYEMRLQLGRIAYLAYGEMVGGVTHDGRPMPGWDELGDRIRAAWCHSAAVVHGVQVVTADEPFGLSAVDGAVVADGR